MSQSSDANPQYWNQYSPRQYIKHQIVRHYLNGWFPKLGLWAGRILYVDTHAGRGRHRSGQFGSPIVALRTFLEHTSRDKILGKSKVEFKFLERDRNNCEFLGQEISNLGPIPTGIECTVIHANSFDYLLDLCKGLIDAGKNMPPSFLFIDPYSYKVPCEVLRQLKTFRRCELFVNVMWRYLNMVIGNSAKSSSSTNTLNEIFGCSDWRSLLLIDDYEKRAEYAVQILRRNINARWATPLRVKGKNGITNYILLHLTDHPQGRDLIKDVIWKCCPDGSYEARQSDDPSQMLLFPPTPDLRPVEEWIEQKLKIGAKRRSELEEDFRDEHWRLTHLNDRLKAMYKDGRIKSDGKLSRSANSRLTWSG